MACDQELCPNWAGDGGCPCAVLDLPRVEDIDNWENPEECPACDTPLAECPYPAAACCEDCNHAANYDRERTSPADVEASMWDDSGMSTETINIMSDEGVLKVDVNVPREFNDGELREAFGRGVGAGVARALEVIGYATSVQPAGDAYPSPPDPGDATPT